MDYNHTQVTYECSVKEIKEDIKESVKEEAFQAMGELEGWCTRHKASVMMDLVFWTKPKVVVEIGVWGGKSLIPMAFAVKALGEGKVYGIDPWDNQESTAGQSDEANREWWGKVDHEMIYKGFLAKLKKFELEDYVEVIRASSADAPVIPLIDILHIDGNHSQETSIFDVLKWVPLVRPGGLIIFDDVDWPTTKKASSLVEEYGAKFLEFKEGNVWNVWIKH